jgi:hypothetical protein
MCGGLPVKDTLVTIVSRLSNTEPSAKLAYRDEALFIVLINVVCFLSGPVLPDELGNTYAVVYTTNWDYAATATPADMFALVVQEPFVDVGSLASEDPERDGEQYRWFIPAGSTLS